MNVNGAIVCYREQRRIRYRGRWVRYEWHPWLCPHPLRADGEPWEGRVPVKLWEAIARNEKRIAAKEVKP
jgi:hypothetical protein